MNYQLQGLTLTVFGVTNSVQASLMIEQPKDASCGWTPLTVHFDAVVVAALGVVDGVSGVVAGVVEIALVVVEGAAGVVEGALGVVEGAAGVVEGALGVVEGAAGVVDNCLFFLLAPVQGAVTVTFAVPGAPFTVTVDVTSLIGTKELQKAEALRATSTALQTATLSRASTSPRPMLAADVRREKETKVATIEAEGMCVAAK
jgi:hypothetical protein